MPLAPRLGLGPARGAAETSEEVFGFPEVLEMLGRGWWMVKDHPKWAQQKKDVDIVTDSSTMFYDVLCLGLCVNPM